MVTLALDTNVIVEIVRGKRPPIRDRFDEAVMGDQPLVASLIVLHELLYGCARHPQPREERTRVETALSDVVIEPLDEADIAAAAAVRSNLAKVGRPIGAYDLLIAGQALARDWTLVTANTREFNRIEGLKVIDWSAPTDTSAFRKEL